MRLRFDVKHHDRQRSGPGKRDQGARSNIDGLADTKERNRIETQVLKPLSLATDWFRNSTDPAKAVQRHIKLLHEYNEIRDVALNFVGKIAEKERCRAIDVLKDYDMDEKD